jgi:hypothetical protein
MFGSDPLDFDDEEIRAGGRCVGRISLVSHFPNIEESAAHKRCATPAWGRDPGGGHEGWVYRWGFFVLPARGTVRSGDEVQVSVG